MDNWMRLRMRALKSNLSVRMKGDDVIISRIGPNGDTFVRLRGHDVVVFLRRVVALRDMCEIPLKTYTLMRVAAAEMIS